MELGAHSIVSIFTFVALQQLYCTYYCCMLYVFTYFPLNCEVHSSRLNLKETANLPENRNYWEPHISNVMQEPKNIFENLNQTPFWLREQPNKP